MRYALLFLTALLAGCSANGPVFNEARLSKGNEATVVIYRLPEYAGSAIRWDVDINTATACSLHYKSFYAFERGPGQITISSSLFASPGTSKISLDLKPRQKYYVKMEMDTAKQVAAGVGGMAGLLVAEGASSTGGPFVFTLVEPETAIRELQGLKQDCM